MRIACLGLGAMGARMAARLSTAGHDLVVWNRSPQAAAGLAATVAASPAEAVLGAEIVSSMLADDVAAQAVWNDGGALDVAQAGALVVECSTLSIPRIDAFAATARERGLRPVDAPVLGSRPQADAGALIFLAGGDDADIDALRPVLTPLAGAVHAVGLSGAGARAKLAANALFAAQVAMAGEITALLGGQGFSAEATAALFAELPVCSPVAAGAFKIIAQKLHEPLFPLSLAAKDLRYVRDAAKGAPIIAALADRFAAAEAAGLGARNLTAIAQAKT